MKQEITGPNGPVEFELKIHVTNGEQNGVATVGMGLGRYPSPQDIEKRLEKFAQDELPNIAPGYRLMTSRELWDVACLEKAGETFAVPLIWQNFHPIA